MTPEEKKAFLEMTGLSQEDLAPEKPEPKTFTKEEFDRASVAALQEIARGKDLNGEAKMAMSLAAVLYLAYLKKNLFGEEKA